MRIRNLRARLMRPAAVTVLGAIAILGAGCGAVNIVTSGDPATGKALFETKCGSCHTLADAGTKGTIGPNLDDAFVYVKKQGFKEQSIRDVVRGQIAYSEADPGTGTATAPNPGMPPNIVTGQDARDVAVYVAKCSAVPSCGVTAAAGG
jgi:mono/diheme cytochrome c family protein